jgi:hypothetical protein
MLVVDLLVFGVAALLFMSLVENPGTARRH